MLIVVAIVGALVNAELVGASDLAIHFFPAARAAFFFGFCASVILYNRGEQVLKAGKLDKGTSCTTVAGPRTAAAASTKEFDNLSAVDHFFCGYEWNPRGVSTRIDLKVCMRRPASRVSHSISLSYLRHPALSRYATSRVPRLTLALTLVHATPSTGSTTATMRQRSLRPFLLHPCDV